ncbi:response regulator transcription factor [Paraburkholderia fynbosensis]|uniref:Response regulatory domain-containing protein n=1 Tax=Paraburkholderia fynbosensis TaxID=1200993 RepID=A0A6J5GWL2_9BURK|nr:response regulator transcription factor [Paraburkholderia fynbosensis]CAB3806564.1 hypothetical protein LMG27177_06117 [Paraburkholderia fynbosensis]
MNILLVEDNTAQAAAVENAMQESGHRISKVNCGDSAMRFLRSNEVDLVTLDWQLRGTTGLEVLQWIRGNLGREQAVLFLTARLSEADIVQALEAGADDYVVKPFRADELAARAGALLHRTTRNENTAKAVSVGSYIHTGSAVFTSTKQSRQASSSGCIRRARRSCQSMRRVAAGPANYGGSSLTMCPACTA